MRPRPDAAENCRDARRAARQTPCFNEAAARCRGKHPPWVRGYLKALTLQ